MRAPSPVTVGNNRFPLELELNLDDALDLLARAGYTLAACNKADLIAAYFIEHGIYDVFQLNEALFAFDQPCLGA